MTRTILPGLRTGVIRIPAVQITGAPDADLRSTLCIAVSFDFGRLQRGY